MRHRLASPIRTLALALCLLAALAVSLAHAQSAGRGAAPGAASAAAPAAAELEAGRRVVVRFLTDTDFAPFNYTDEEGALVGFNVDLARAICLEMEATCDIKSRPWDELFTALERNEADAVIAGHAVTARALAKVDFTESYFHMPGRFAAMKSETKTDVEPSTLYGKKIAVRKGTAHEAYLRAFFRDSAITAYDTPEAAREALMTKKADYLFEDGVALVLWVNGTSSRDCCELRGGPFLEPRYFGDGMAIAVRKSDPQMRLLLDRALKKVRASGRLDELMLRYFPARVY
jgi:polar amino acid transport system substrate-binding protein